MCFKLSSSIPWKEPPWKWRERVGLQAKAAPQKPRVPPPAWVVAAARDRAVPGSSASAAYSPWPKGTVATDLAISRAGARVRAMGSNESPADVIASEPPRKQPRRNMFYFFCGGDR